MRKPFLTFWSASLDNDILIKTLVSPMSDTCESRDRVSVSQKRIFLVGTGWFPMLRCRKAHFGASDQCEFEPDPTICPTPSTLASATQESNPAAIIQEEVTAKSKTLFMAAANVRLQLCITTDGPYEYTFKSLSISRRE